MRPLAAVLLATSPILLGETAGAETRDVPEVSLMKSGPGLRRGFVFTPEAAPPLPPSGPILLPQHRTIYLNRNGGFYSGGTDDSTLNRSSVISYYESAGGTLSPFPFGDGPWDLVMQCVRERYGAFDVTVTDEDPGPVPHIEIAVAGKPEEIGLPEGCCLGVAPFACTPIDNAVTYAFAGVHSNSVEDLCWTILQETAHALGLDHEVLCEDPMTYDYSCGSRKEFADQAAPCGEDASRACMCGGSTQNSVAMLKAVLGENDDAIPPDVRITRPQNGAIVPPGFTVDADATDDVGVASVELLIDGQVASTDTAAPWSFMTSADLPDGDHTVEVRASDARGNVEVNMVRVTVDRGADPGGDPGGGGGGGGAGGDGTGENVIVGGCSAASAAGRHPAAGALALLLSLAAMGLRRLALRKPARRSNG